MDAEGTSRGLQVASPPRWAGAVRADECCPTSMVLLGWAWRQVLEPAQKLLLLAYCNHGSTVIDVGMEFTGLDRFEVMRHTAVLRDQGYLPLPGDPEMR